MRGEGEQNWKGREEEEVMMVKERRNGRYTNCGGENEE